MMIQDTEDANIGSLQRPPRHSFSSSTISLPFRIFSASSASESTIWGPGTLTGKGLSVFGERVLGWFNDRAIRRRLDSIEAGMVLQGKRARNSNTGDETRERIFTDLLELSRWGLYENNTRKRAMELIVVQIRMPGNDILADCINKWPLVETSIFMQEFLKFVWLSSSARVSRPRAIPFDAHTLPIFCKISQIHETLYVQLLKQGLLDMILQTHNHPSFNSYLATANTTMQMYSEISEAQEFILDHPLYDIWPSDVPFFLRGSLPVSRYINGRRLGFNQILATQKFGHFYMAEFLKKELVRESGGELLDLVVDLSIFAKPQGPFTDIVYPRLYRVLERLTEARILHKMCCDALGEDVYGLTRVFSPPLEHPLLDVYFASGPELELETILSIMSKIGEAE